MTQKPHPPRPNNAIHSDSVSLFYKAISLECRVGTPQFSTTVHDGKYAYVLASSPAPFEDKLSSPWVVLLIWNLQLACIFWDGY
ncbi:hypothetical protein POX_g08827 [Penicillium oxalicum]|uniref:hypothetical protein n=1 Tax=Penicillium oxalicum TaxID=69781 RepID=UPI0020B708F0|nr:hypothetical protein POX_g08827 [Penicillium oxalicum]KAI2786442.1 hypothetical protein POX_g08827 [Penicillium oxalicum]